MVLGIGRRRDVELYRELDLGAGEARAGQPDGEDLRHRGHEAL